MSTVLVLRTCNADMTSKAVEANGFLWPDSGPVEAPDWSPEPVCGKGLHGLLWGEGNSSMLDWSEGAKWLAVEVGERDIVDLDGKVKFPHGNVVACGDRRLATDYLYNHGASGKQVHGGTATAGSSGTATAGDMGTATAGERGTATAGDGGTINVQWWEECKQKWRRCVAEVGENGIEPNQPYRLEVIDGEAKFVKAS